MKPNNQRLAQDILRNLTISAKRGSIGVPDSSKFIACLFLRELSKQNMLDNFVNRVNWEGTEDSKEKKFNKLSPKEKLVLGEICKKETFWKENHPSNLMLNFIVFTALLEFAPNSQGLRESAALGIFAGVTWYICKMMATSLFTTEFFSQEACDKLPDVMNDFMNAYREAQKNQRGLG